MRRVVWFSCGAASAFAARVATVAYDDVEVVYCDTFASEHPDNRRFFADVEKWIGRKITVIQSEKYTDVDDVFQRRRFMAGPHGAICTTEMKKVPREAFQRSDDTHIFGFTYDEQKRADSFEEHNLELHCEHVLIDRGVTKADCLEQVAAAGIALPAMYALGFDHNNCPGCVKATSPGYWNRVREHFPAIFAQRARQSRLIGARLVRIKNVRHFLDELPAGEMAPDDTIECGPGCQTEMKW